MSSIDFFKNSTKAIGKRWRTIASAMLFLCGLLSVFWGTYNLVEVTQVPICANAVDELLIEKVDLQDADEEGQLLPDGSQLGSIQVEIQGAIKNPGVYWLNYTSRLGELIEMAGGLTQAADKQLLSQQYTLSAKLKDEQKITIPNKQEKKIEEIMTEYCQSVAVTTKPVTIQAQAEESVEEEINNQVSFHNQECVSINYASSTQLQTISGIGEKTAELIIEGRPYFNVSDLLEIKGIGDATLEKIEPLICL